MGGAEGRDRGEGALRNELGKIVWEKSLTTKVEDFKVKESVMSAREFRQLGLEALKQLCR